MNLPFITVVLGLFCGSLIHADIRYTENDPYNGVSVVMPAGADKAAVEDLATRVRPSARQVRWQEYGMLGFIHFNLNTYTGREWGTGTEDLSIFNPTQLDAEQWIQTFQEAGIQTVILVCKHHDGFCLWPSKHRERTVANTPWRDGKGDVVAEVAEACRKYGMRMAVYYSPWDKQPPYGKPEYNDLMVAELTELLTNYGYIDLVWFDGAGIDPKVSGVQMDFDWQRIYHTIRTLQPQALISGAGPDIRWVGNEGGRGRFTEWSVQGIALSEAEFSGFDCGVPVMAPQLGNIEHLVKRKNLKQLVWYPARGGLPIRHQWFWRKGQKTRTLDYMVNSYFDTVGQNSNLLVNLSPNPQGLIPQSDINRMKELGLYLRQMYRFDYANGATAEGKPTRSGGYSANYLFNDDLSTCWAAPDGVRNAEVEVNLFGQQTFNVVHLAEAIRDFGQRIRRFEIDAMTDNEWKTIGKATTIGFRRLLRVPLTTTEKLRIRIVDSRGPASLAKLALYRTPELTASLKITRDASGKVTIQGTDAPIYYTTDGTKPGKAAAFYQGPFSLAGGGIVRAVGIADNGQVQTPQSSQSFGLMRNDWSADETDGRFAFDGNTETIWEKDIHQKAGEFIVDLGKVQTITAVGYLPPQNNETGHISGYEIYVSQDRKSWGTPVAAGKFNNVVNNPIERICPLPQEIQTRYVKFTAVSTEQSSEKAGIAELQLYSHKFQ